MRDADRKCFGHPDKRPTETGEKRPPAIRLKEYMISKHLHHDKNLVAES